MLSRFEKLYGEHRFASLLVALLIFVLAPSVLIGFGVPVALFDGLFALVVLAAIVSLFYRRRQRIFALLIGVPTIALSLGGHALTGRTHVWAILVGHLCAVVLFFGAAWVIVWTLLRGRRVITADSVFGAICGYLLIGIGWGLLFATVDFVRPESFAISPALRQAEEAEGPRPFIFIYYSFVTLTTVGYGDVTPVAPPARTLAWMEAVAGQFYMAVIVAGLISSLVSAALHRSQPRNQDRP